MPVTPVTVEVCCCYAHADEKWLRKLETHLSLLQRQGLISLWHDRLITTGTNWAQVIDAHLESSSIILLFISPDFLASGYWHGAEMKRALERQTAGEAQVIPILVRPVDWSLLPFARLPALPADAKPLAIWKSQDSALANIAAGIRRAIEELPQLSASAPRPALPLIWNIPYPSNPFFVGRDHELAQLRQSLQTERATALSQPYAISGLGGIGKTQLALEYAYRFHQDYQAVLWVLAESREVLVSSYVNLAYLLNLPEKESQDQTAAIQAVKVWLQTHRDWLLILDNADELSLLPAFLPSSLGGHVILTTRSAVTGRLAHRLEIETLLPEQGALFLLRRAGLVAHDADLALAAPQEREIALQISQELGELPLALDQAGAYIEETQCSLEDYLDRYRAHRQTLLRRRGQLATDYPHSVATTWLLSFAQVEQRNPAAADLLRLCTFLHPDAIPEEMLTKGAALLGPRLAPLSEDSLLFNRAVETLRVYSLIHRDAKSSTLSIHRLVQIALQGQLAANERQRWTKRAALAVNAAFPSVEFGFWMTCERYLPHALLCASWIERTGMIFPEAVRLLNQTGLYLAERGRYTEAEPSFQRALMIQEQLLGPHVTNTIGWRICKRH